jgi:hypothetical protein
MAFHDVAPMALSFFSCLATNISLLTALREVRVFRVQRSFILHQVYRFRARSDLKVARRGGGGLILTNGSSLDDGLAIELETRHLVSYEGLIKKRYSGSSMTSMLR